MPAIDPLTALMHAGIGFVGALAGSMAGLGGGFIILPALTLLGLPPQNAVADTKAAVFANSLLSTLTNWASGPRPPAWLYAAVAVPMIAMAYVGAWAAAALPGRVVVGVAAVAILAGAVRLVLGKSKERTFREMGLTNGRVVVAALSGALSGFVAGITGLGGGVVNMPVFTNILHLAPADAASLSLSCILPSAATALVRHVIDSILTPHALPLALGAAAGGFTGSRIARRVRPSVLRYIIAVFVSASAARMVLKALGLA